MEEDTHSENATWFWSIDMMLIYPSEWENVPFCNIVGKTMGIWMYIMMKMLSKNLASQISKQFLYLPVLPRWTRVSCTLLYLTKFDFYERKPLDY